MTGLLARLRRLPLPNTMAALAALLVLPSAALLIWPRPQAVGLARLLDQAQLMQSFGASAARPLPGLWRQRLGAAAPALWARQQGVWWQFWGAHDDAGAYLVLPALSLSGLGSAPTATPPLVVDDVVVFAADPLSRQWLVDRLRTVARPQRGLEQRCLLLLRRPQSVAWTPAGLGALAGPVAPLLQRLQQGCLSLELNGGNLELSGEAAASQGVLGSSRAVALDLPQRPLPADVLLELQGPSLQVLLQGLLSRQLVREPLAARYGITEPQLALLKQLPFVLRLRQQASGPFQAALELTVAPAARDRPAWAQLLAGLRDPLQQQGLQEPPARLQASGPRLQALPFPNASWSNEEGAVVGGWFWSLPPGSAGGALLTLHLGPPPPGASARSPMPAGPAQPLQLRARPGELNRLGLWPGSFPALVARAAQLELLASGGASEPLSQLKGRLVPNRSR